ncbi:hypothetical protein NPIL_546831 [Nephila pilipes]|uniref:Uncharacterized protein n=1 Tax=Nephila pilipes TaxID=299642 RepID=A0A8X6QT44_NEPPI|nr:hypothetical protein NPIL_546831 [Nephila pilipes]
MGPVSAKATSHRVAQHVVGDPSLQMINHYVSRHAALDVQPQIPGVLFPDVNAYKSRRTRNQFIREQRAQETQSVDGVNNWSTGGKRSREIKGNSGKTQQKISARVKNYLITIPERILLFLPVGIGSA